MSLNQWKPRNNNFYYTLCFHETIKLLQPLDCLLPPIVSDSKDEDGLKLEKFGHIFYYSELIDFLIQNLPR